MDAVQLLAELRKPETMEALQAAVMPHIRRGARTLVYPMPFADAVGHLGPESHYLASLHGSDYDRLILLLPPRALPSMKKPLYDLVARDFAMAETTHPPLLYLRDLDRGLTQLGPITLLLQHTHKFYRAYTLHRAARKPLVHLTLSEEMRERGRVWLASAGLDPDGPYVALHMRNASYSHDSQSAPYGVLRSVDLETARQAVDWLVGQGYAVLRMGDTKAPRFEHPSDRVIDLPFDDRYEDFLDVFLCATCTFSLNCQSGPEGMVRAFGRPSVNTNLMPTVLSHHLDHDIFLFKSLYLADSESPMSYAEQLDYLMPNRLVTGPLQDLKWYRHHDIRSRDCSPDELVAAVEEMHRRLAGETIDDGGADARFIAMSRDYEARIAQDPVAQFQGNDVYAYAHGMGRLSASWASMNPWFLG